MTETAFPLDFLQPPARPESMGRLGDYDIVEILGRGAVGIVLRGFDEKLCRMVAIKVLAPELAAMSPVRKRFLREARASAAVRHPHVVRIYAVEEKPLPHVVMEYIPGRTLQRQIDECGPLQVAEVLRLGIQIAGGLAAAHSIGLIHGDIKPGNILLEADGEDRVKITDFGLARAADDACSTQSGFVGSTSTYMSPEQAKGAKIDPRSDLFSLGSVLYAMATGRPPSLGSTSSENLNRLADEEACPIQEIPSTVPRWLCNIIARLHATRPEDRIESASEVARILGDCHSDMKRGINPSTTLFETSRWSIGRIIGRNRGILIAIMFALIILAMGRTMIIKKGKTQPLEKAGGEVRESRPPSGVKTAFALGALLEPSRMGDGSFADVSFVDNIVTLDGAGNSPNLWLDFLDIEGSELTIQTQLRVLNPERDGFTKLVFKPHGAAEVFMLFSGDSSREELGWIIDSSKSRDQGIPIPQIKASAWIDIRFVVSRGEYMLYVDDELFTKIVRKQRSPGYVAIGCGGWRTEMKNLQVILNEADIANE